MDTHYLATDYFFLEVKSQNQVIQEVRILKSRPDLANLEVPSFLTQLQAELSLFVNGKSAFFTLDERFNLVRTPFQNQVYKALRKTAPGETMTYKQLAEKCQRPLAARAVGSAMRKNPFPLIIPCHRIVPSHGKSLGHYSGSDSKEAGEKTKHELISLEKLLFQKAPSISQSVSR